MKYSIQSIQYYNTLEEAQKTFNEIAKTKDKLVDINIGKVNEEKSIIKLIEIDHDLPAIERTGCKVLSTINKDEVKIIEK